MVRIRQERGADVVARDALLDAALGPFRRLKTSERLREGRLPAAGLSFVASTSQQLVGTVRLWSITAGPGRPALLLGPLAVDEGWRQLGIGAARVNTAIEHALKLDHRAILLVGAPAYYGRFGFNNRRTSALRLPGPGDPERLLGIELVRGALEGASGLIAATGRLAPRKRSAGRSLASHGAIARRSSTLARLISCCGLRRRTERPTTRTAVARAQTMGLARRDETAPDSWFAVLCPAQVL